MTTNPLKTEAQTDAVQINAPSEIDWTAIDANWQKRRDAEAAAGQLERVALLEALRGKGIVVVEARYDGYADSGNVGEIDLSPEDADLDDLAGRLQDFIWSTAYGLHPGFEIDDGAEGTFSWDITADRIDIDHANFYTERDEHCHEDI